MPRNTNLSMIKTVVRGLGDLVNDVVFVGGAVTELYVPDPNQLAEVRQTDDADCIIEITSRWEYAQLEEKLRQLKFANNQKVICRWHYEDIIVDVMPTDETILGFPTSGIKMESKTHSSLQLKRIAKSIFFNCHIL